MQNSHWCISNFSCTFMFSLHHQAIPDAKYINISNFHKLWRSITVHDTHSLYIFHLAQFGWLVCLSVYCAILQYFCILLSSPQLSTLHLSSFSSHPLSLSYHQHFFKDKILTFIYFGIYY